VIAGSCFALLAGRNIVIGGTSFENYIKREISSSDKSGLYLICEPF
jgi:hypothetical protein